MSGDQGSWSEKDQKDAAEKGQGAEIGGSHDEKGGSQKPAETNRDQEATPESNPS